MPVRDHGVWLPVLMPLQPARRALVPPFTVMTVLQAVAEARATVLVLDRGALVDPRVVDAAAPLHEGGVRVRTLLEFYEGWLGKLPVGELERASLFFDIGEVHRTTYGRIKRLIDLAIGAAGLVAVLLVTPVVAAVIPQPQAQEHRGDEHAVDHSGGGEVEHRRRHIPATTRAARQSKNAPGEPGAS